jgi:hypothetical protein
MRAALISKRLYRARGSRVPTRHWTAASLRHVSTSQAGEARTSESGNRSIFHALSDFFKPSRCFFSNITIAALESEFGPYRIHAPQDVLLKINLWSSGNSKSWSQVEYHLPLWIIL